MEALDSLVKINPLKKEPPDQAEIKGMVKAATTKWQDVKLLSFPVLQHTIKYGCC